MLNVVTLKNVNEGSIIVYSFYNSVMTNLGSKILKENSKISLGVYDITPCLYVSFSNLSMKSFMVMRALKCSPWILWVHGLRQLDMVVLYKGAYGIDLVIQQCSHRICLPCSTIPIICKKYVIICNIVRRGEGKKKLCKDREFNFL